MVISCVAYSCTNRQKTGSNISLFSGNFCRKCLCCVSVYVNECNSFENVTLQHSLHSIHLFDKPCESLPTKTIDSLNERAHFFT